MTPEEKLKLDLMMKDKNISHEEIMKDVFRPLSKKVQELITVGGEVDGKSYSKEEAKKAMMIEPTLKNPEWGIRYKRDKPIPEDIYIPNSPLKKEALTIGPKSPAATQYLEALDRRGELDKKRKEIDFLEKYKYERFPEPISNPKKLNIDVEKQYKRMKDLKSLYLENFNKLEPSMREKIQDEIDFMEQFLGMAGKLQKA